MRWNFKVFSKKIAGIAGFLFCRIIIFSVQPLPAQTFEVKFDTTSYVQVEPFHRSCPVWATVRNTGSQTEKIILDVHVEPSEGWYFHSPLYLYLQPGETERPLALVAQYKYGNDRMTADFHIFAESDTSTAVDVSVDVTRAGVQTPEFTFPIRVDVNEKNTGEFLTDADVYIWAGSRPERARLKESGFFELMVIPYDTLKNLAQQYDVSWDGYFLEVHCAGYRSYYEDSIVPVEGSDDIFRSVSLEPLDVTADYQSAWYYPLEYPGVWKIIPSEDWTSLAVSMGKHPDPWDEHPCPTEVHLFDLAGTLHWSYPVNEEVWGIDITSDGSLVAAGTSGGMLSVIDLMGNLVWQHIYPTETTIREVRFSHNGNYLCYETSPFKLFGAGTGDTLWEFPFIDAHWRGISFSSDDAYVAFGGGESLLLLDIDGNFLWEKYIGGTLPYYIGLTPGLSKIVVADKGDLLSCFDGSGNLLWRYYMDVLTDAHMSADGSRVVTLSHDGIVRMYDGAGNLLWRRTVEGAGHNGLYMTDDGKYIIIGGGSIERPYKTMLLDEHGNLLWEHSQPGPIPNPYHPYLISAMCVVVSEDASHIVSGYGTGAPGIQLFQGAITGIEGEDPDFTLPADLHGLSQNFPNPFNPSTTISFIVGGANGRKQHVNLTVYDVRGRRVKTLIDYELEPGNHQIHWDGGDEHGNVVASGIYLYRLKTCGKTITRKMTILK